jgi:periplasmic divalent cation tolerance protein
MISSAGLAEADQIAEALVQQRLAACVQILPMQSRYRWQGEVVRDNEILLLVKTRADLYPALEAAVLKLHSYQTPEIIQVPVLAGLPAYLDWLRENTGPQAEGQAAPLGERADLPAQAAAGESQPVQTAIPWAGRCSPAEVRQAAALLTRPERLGQVTRWLLPALTLGLLGWVVWDTVQASGMLAAGLPQFIRLFLLVALGYFSLLPLLAARRVQHGMQKHPRLQTELEGTLSAQGVRLWTKTTGGEEDFLPWTVFEQRLTAPDLLVLASGQGKLCVLPRRFFADQAAWQQALAWSAQHVQAN